MIRRLFNNQREILEELFEEEIDKNSEIELAFINFEYFKNLCNWNEKFENFQGVQKKSLHAYD